MSNKNGRGKAKGKKSAKPPTAALPAAFPLYAIGSFLLSLFIPATSPSKPLEK